MKIAKELMDVLSSKKVSHDDAETIASVFERSVRESNEKAKEVYMKKGIFRGSPPEG